ncbi:MAG TPA: RbsD/FucU family protein [Chthonomonadaceae bacterium]|nr:RbsD/FucU family protein [Chthonomonadaceae bacterium]
MLKTGLIHPEILDAIGSAGHGSQILIADGNYPCSTTAGPNARIVYLNLAPGLLTATDVLRTIAPAVPIEAARVMQPADGSRPPIFAEFEALLGSGARLQPIERFAFYEAAGQPQVCLAIATGEQRIYANILLTIGVVPPPGA